MIVTNWICWKLLFCNGMLFSKINIYLCMMWRLIRKTDYTDLLRTFCVIHPRQLTLNTSTTYSDFSQLELPTTLLNVKKSVKPSLSWDQYFVWMKYITSSINKEIIFRLKSETLKHAVCFANCNRPLLPANLYNRQYNISASFQVNSRHSTL